MSDGTLSQAEIDALMQGTDNLGGDPGLGGGDAGGGALSDAEQEKLKEVLNESATSLGEPLSGMSGKTVAISDASIEFTNNAGIETTFGSNFVEIQINYTGDVSGENVIYLSMTDALVLSALSMQEDVTQPPAELDQVHQSALSETINQMFSSGLSALKSKYSKDISVEQPKIKIISDPSTLLKFASDSVASISYTFSIEGLLSTNLFQVMDKGAAAGMARLAVSSAPMSFDMGDGDNIMDSFDQTPMQSATVGDAGNAQGLDLPQFGAGVEQEQQGNISLLMDVPMSLTVELGRTKMMIKEILGLGEGSIIELDKLAGEPVDLLVNGKLIAKGEVVVIDENFGVRVTDIISQAERMSFAE